MRDGITVFVPKGFSVLLWGCSAVLALVPVGFAIAGELAKMTVWAGRRRVSVEALMQGSEVFWAYIEQNVAPDKIVTKGRGRRGGRA